MIDGTPRNVHIESPENQKMTISLEPVCVAAWVQGLIRVSETNLCGPCRTLQYQVRGFARLALGVDKTVLGGFDPIGSNGVARLAPGGEPNY
jgi:hypothetical protein